MGGRRRGSLTRRYFRKRRFSSLEDARGNPIGFLANSLRLQRCLLVLDGCDEAMQDPEFKHFLGRLLDEVSRPSMVAAKLVSHILTRSGACVWQTKFFKLLLTAREPLGRIPGFGRECDEGCGATLRRH